MACLLVQRDTLSASTGNASRTVCAACFGRPHAQAWGRMKPLIDCGKYKPGKACVGLLGAEIRQARPCIRAQCALLQH